MMAFGSSFGNRTFGFTPEQLDKLMTPPTPPPTGIETMAGQVGMSDFTAEVPAPVPVPEPVDYSGFNPYADGASFTGVTPPVPVPEPVPVPVPVPAPVPAPVPETVPAPVPVPEPVDYYGAYTGVTPAPAPVPEPVPVPVPEPVDYYGAYTGPVPGSEVPGSEVLGSQGLGSEVPGSEVLGSQGLGSEVLGSQGLGSEVPGSEGPGSEGPGSVDPTQPSSADAVPGIPDYGAYVNSFPDLEEAYRNRGNRDQSIEEWGKAHYDRHGRDAGRTLPTRPPLDRETGGFYNPFNPDGGSFTRFTQDDAAPVDPIIANLTPMPPRDANVRASTNYRLTAAPPISASTQGDPFERPEEGILSLRASNPRGPFRRPATPEGGR